MLKTIPNLWLLFPWCSSENANHRGYFKFGDEPEVPVDFRPVKTCCSSHTGVVSSNSVATHCSCLAASQQDAELITHTRRKCVCVCAQTPKNMPERRKQTFSLCAYISHIHTCVYVFEEIQKLDADWRSRQCKYSCYASLSCPPSLSHKLK